MSNFFHQFFFITKYGFLGDWNKKLACTTCSVLIIIIIISKKGFEVFRGENFNLIRSAALTP